MNLEPSAVLERQLPYVSGGDGENVRRVLNGAGPIRMMNCLEALLLATQAERSTSQGRSMYTHPTEFSSYVLQSGDFLKIWYYTVDQPGLRGLAMLHEPLMADVQQGWVALTHIHPTDPLTFCAFVVLLSVAAAAASYFPTRMAMRTDPTVARRQE
jgi:hypothetical protein